jgi:hypothetical protein
MTPQTICQLVSIAGVAITAFGGLGSYYFGKVESAEKQRAADAAQNALKDQIASLQSSVTKGTELIFQKLGIKTGEWITLEMKNVPLGVTDYLLLLFKSDAGRISGKVRIQGSDSVAHLSTTANSTVPVAVPNLWLPKEQHYKEPTILEFSVTQKTDPSATLSIFTSGWIDSRGREPH